MARHGHEEDTRLTFYLISCFPRSMREAMMGTNKEKSPEKSMFSCSGKGYLPSARSVVTLVFFSLLFFLLLLFLDSTPLQPDDSQGPFLFVVEAEDDGWSQAEEEFTSNHYIGHVEMKVDSEDNLHYFWEQSLYKGKGADQTLDRELLYRKVSADGRVQVIDTQISTTTLSSHQDSSYPQLLIDSHNTPHLIWKETRDENGATLLYCHLDEYGEKYFQPLAFVDDSAFVATMPTAAIDGDDNIHVVWFDIRYDLYNESKITSELCYSMLRGRPEGVDGRYKKPLNSEGLTLIDDTKITDACPSVDLVDPEIILAQILADPKIAFPDSTVDADGVVHLVWSDCRDGNAEIYYTAFDPGKDDADGDPALRNQIKLVEDKRLSYSSEQSLYPNLNMKSDGSLDLVFVENNSSGKAPLRWSLQYFSLESGQLVAADTIYESQQLIAFPRVVGASLAHSHVSWVVSAPGEDTVFYRKIRLSDLKTEMKKTIYEKKGVSFLSTDVDTNDNIYVVWSHNAFSEAPWTGSVLKRYYNAKPDFTLGDDSPGVANIYSLDGFVDDYLEEIGHEEPSFDDFTDYMNGLKMIYKEKENIEISLRVKNAGNKSGEILYLSFFSTEQLSQNELEKLESVRLPPALTTCSPENPEHDELTELITRLKYADIRSLVLDIEPKTGSLCLSPNEESELKLRFKIDVGEYYFYTILDPLNTIHESEESNNLIEYPLVVFNSYPSAPYFNGPERESGDQLPASYNFSFCVNVIEPREWLLRHEQNAEGDRADDDKNRGTGEGNPFSVRVRILLNGEEYEEKTVHIKSELAGMYIIGDKKTELVKQHVSFELFTDDLLSLIEQEGTRSGEPNDVDLKARSHHITIMVEPQNFESLVCDNFVAEILHIPLHNDVSIDHLSVLDNEQQKDPEELLYPEPYEGSLETTEGTWGNDKGGEKRVYSRTEGEQIFVSAVLSNRGDLALVCELSFYIDEQAEDFQLAKRAVYLLPHSSKNVTISLVPEKGTHTLIAVADERNIILEYNEENNVRTIILKIRERKEDKPFLEQHSSTAVVVGSLGVLSLFFAFLFSEPGKYKFFALLFPLYTRLKKEEVLDQFLRGQIYGYIKAHPGAHYNQLKRDLDINNGNLSYHLKVLERERFIKSERDGINRRFYPWGMKVAKDAFHLSDVQQQITGIIEKNPGLSQKEIAKIAGMSTQVINYHIRILTQARVLRLGKKGRKTLCYVNVTD